MEPINNLETALLSIYNASYGGNYELAGEINHKDILAEQGWITYARCRKDPKSTHNASSCRIVLTRMTETGINEAKGLVQDKYEEVVEFLNNLETLPPRVEALYRYLMKKWLNASKKRASFDWTLRRDHARYYLNLSLPGTVVETISTLKDTLVEKGLASYGSLSHKTSGPSEPTLVTCPEIYQLFMRGRGWKEPYARGVQPSELDEYLQYLLNGLCLVKARYHLMFFFPANRNSISPSTVDWLYEEYGVYRDSLMSFLEELEDSDYIHILNEEQRQDEYVLASGNPLIRFAHVTQDIDTIEKQVKEKVLKWFDTGEESFQRFGFTRTNH